MGRGRAKAKQTKVARDLKYHTQDTDFTRLQAELSSAPVGGGGSSHEDDQYADYADRYSDDDDDDGDAGVVVASR